MKNSTSKIKRYNHPFDTNIFVAIELTASLDSDHLQVTVYEINCGEITPQNEYTHLNVEDAVTRFETERKRFVRLGYESRN